MNLIIKKKILNFLHKHKGKDLPVIAFILDKNYNFIAWGINNQYKKSKIYGHAEINVINKIYKAKKINNFKDYILITTMEPCMMCLGAILQVNIKNIYYYVANKKYGYLESNHTFDISSLKIKKIQEKNVSFLIKEKLKKFFQTLKNK